MNARIAYLVVLTLTLALFAGTPVVRADVPAPAGPITIRPQYKEGMRLEYRWRLSAKNAWVPAQQGVDYLAGDTDFTFTLVGKTLRDNGSLTLNVFGEALHALGESNKGRLGIEANAKQAKVLINKDWFGPSNNTPLANEITITLSPRFEGKFGTGLHHLAPYFLPSVDGTFWRLLTTAPEQPLTPGQTGQKTFQWALPGTSSKPVDVLGAWKVDAPRLYQNQRVLPIRLLAKLELNDTPVVLLNGDRVNLKHAMYEAEGMVYWHIEKGILCYAEASEKCNGYAQPPDQRKIGHIAKSTLELLSAR